MVASASRLRQEAVAQAARARRTTWVQTLAVLGVALGFALVGTLALGLLLRGIVWAWRPFF